MSKVIATNRGDHLSEALIKHIISQMRGQAAKILDAWETLERGLP